MCPQPSQSRLSECSSEQQLSAIHQRQGPCEPVLGQPGRMAALSWQHDTALPLTTTQNTTVPLPLAAHNSTAWPPYLTQVRYRDTGIL